jgi:hypothetical protein
MPAHGTSSFSHPSDHQAGFSGGEDLSRSLVVNMNMQRRKRAKNTQGVASPPKQG